MRIVEPLIVVLLFSFGCSGQKKDCLNKYKYLMYTFETSRSDSTKVGFNLFEDDESYGLKALAILSNSKFVFAVDAANNNVKKIDITTGGMQSSKKLNFKHRGILLYDIAIFQGKVFLTSDRGMLILDTNLNYLGSIESTYRWPNPTWISKVTRDSILVSLKRRQLAYLTVEEDQLVITRDSNFLRKKIIPPNQNLESSKAIKALGKEYQISTSDGKVFLQNEFGCYDLKQPIPSASKYYSARNIDFDKKTIVYFDSTPKQLTLYCYLME